MKDIIRKYRIVTLLLSMVLAVVECSEPSTPKKDNPAILDKPVIKEHPASQVLSVGDTARFSVSATAAAGATLSYQWQVAARGAASFTDVAEARSASCTTSALALTDSGSRYQVVVTATLGTQTSSVTSEAATLSVLPKKDRIVWTDINGAKHYADVPADGVLLSTTLTGDKADIKSVDVIPSGVTSIGDTAFRGSTGLVSIAIPQTVTRIGANAFSSCVGLTSVDIPNEVTRMGEYAFSDCKGLTRVRLSEGLAVLSTGVFAGCTGLTDIGLPSSIDSIGDRAFASCKGLTRMDIPNGVVSIGGNVFLDCTGLLSVVIPASVTRIGERAFLGCKGLTSIDIPSSVTSIADGAFSNSGLTSITLPNTVTSIGSSAFEGCIALTSIDIPSSVTSIADGAFANSGLTSITLPNTVTSIGSSAFEDCIALTSVTLPNMITSIGEYAFLGCTSLVGIVIPSTVTSIGSSAFEGCIALTSVTLPSGVTSIGTKAFSGCTVLDSVHVEATTPPTAGTDVFASTHMGLVIRVPDASVGNYKTAWSSYEDRIYGYGEVVPLKILWTDINGRQRYTNAPTNGILLGSVLTATVTDIKSVDSIPSSITTIGTNAFSGATALTSIVIPSTVNSIGDNAFMGSSALASVRVEATAPPTAGTDMFTNTNASLIIRVPDASVADYRAAVNWSAYANRIYGYNETVPNRIVWIHRDGTKRYANVPANGILLSSTLTATKTDIKSVDTIPSIPIGVTSIGDNAFDGCTNLTSISLPSSISSIGLYGFNGCSALASITLPTSLITISASAFKGCTSLTSVTIPSNVTDIPGGYVFANCTGLRTVIIHNNRIGANMFSGCTSLASITLSSSVMNISSYAFSGCTSLASITLPSSVTSIGSSALSGCSALASVRVEATTPPAANANMFQNTSASLGITVPSASVNAYKAAAGWSTYASRITGY